LPAALDGPEPEPLADPTLDLALQPSGLEGMPAPPARKPQPTVDARHHPTPAPPPLASKPAAVPEARSATRGRCRSSST
jgi:hypothetical protein